MTNNVKFCDRTEGLCSSRKIKSFNPSPMIAGKKFLTSKSETVNLYVKSCVVNHVLFAKGYPQGVHPVRDAFLCIGGYQVKPAPHFVFLITLGLLGGFFSNLAGVCSSPRIFLEYVQ